MLYNPLLGCVQSEPVAVSVRLQWANEVDKSANAIERYIRQRQNAKAFKELHFMDLLDLDTAAWFRENGFQLYGG